MWKVSGVVIILNPEKIVAESGDMKASGSVVSSLGDKRTLRHAPTA